MVVTIALFLYLKRNRLFPGSVQDLAAAESIAEPSYF
jgi:hypothetical protein